MFFCFSGFLVFLFAAFFVDTDEIAIFLAIAIAFLLIGILFCKILRNSAKKDKKDKEKFEKSLIDNKLQQAKREEELAYCVGMEKYRRMTDIEISNFSVAINSMETIGSLIQNSVYQEKERDWAVLGGMANGIAGPAAGIVTATNVIQKNQKIKERNAEQIAWGNEQKNKFNSYAADANEERIKLIVEQRKYQNTHQANLTSDPRKLFSYITISNKRIKRDSVTGVASVSVVWTQNNFNVTIDGALRAYIYSKTGEFYAYAHLIFPKEGTIKKWGELSATCTPAIPEDEYEIIIEPVNLWEIIEKEKTHKKLDLGTNDEREKLLASYEEKFKKEKEKLRKDKYYGSI